MNVIHQILDKVSKDHYLPYLRIVETGCQSTIDIAEWISEKDRDFEVAFTTVDLDGGFQEANHGILESQDIASNCTFLTQDHKKYLTGLRWVDVVFLAPDDLQGGLQEFQLAASVGAKAVIIKDIQTKASVAVTQAERYGWKVEFVDNYAIILRS